MCVTTKPISFFVITLLSRTQHILFQLVTSQLWQRDDVTTKNKTQEEERTLIILVPLS